MASRRCAHLPKSFPAYPDLNGLPFPADTILGVQAGYKIPHSKNIAVGMTSELGPFSARPDYVYTRTDDASIGPDTNWVQNANGTYSRRDPRHGNITLVGNGGSIWYHGLETRLECPVSGALRRFNENSGRI